MNPNTNSNPKILIAGAGPSGLILALALRRLGVPLKIIEKSPTPSTGQRGFGIQPRTQELFHALGVLDDINKRSIVLPPMRSYVSPEGVIPLKTFHLTPPMEPTPARPLGNIITIGQDHLEDVLRIALQKYSCEVEFGTSLVSFTQDADGVDAIIKGEKGQEETHRFDFLIGADGARGVVRKQLGLSFLGESRPFVKFIIADVRIEGIDEEHWHTWGDPKADSVLLRPTGIPGLFQLAITLAGSNGDHDAVMKDQIALQNTINTVTGRTDLNLVEVVWITLWTPNIRMTDTFSAGRCFLTGDAAHVHSPTGGQGINSSAQDSLNLAWKLALVVKGQASTSLLDSYNDERLPVIAEMLGKTTGLLDKTVNADNITGDISRWDRSGPLLMLGVNYRWSVIVLDEQDDGENVAESQKDPYGVRIQGLKAGDRAPDASELKDTRSGQSGVRLFGVFDLARHTVLVFSSAPERYNAVVAQLSRYPEGSAACVGIARAGEGISGAAGQGAVTILEDPNGHAYAAYHSEFKGGCDIVVVRPDGVIGAVVRSPEAVGRYFAKIFA
ncbi:Pentachlorophenol 4-monooxygenase [Mycena venus]|uniref:Pentachlorophenol 4-monooxygenase n=1 Tax=Mycena venus TaxID=2733690 RepID=A0A8H7CZB2_9AGAR|nr:Pentachlorophenol 4-monooxygenase [Mycena venus]